MAAEWKEVVVSGSDAHLNSLLVETDITVTGSVGIKGTLKDSSSQPGTSGQVLSSTVTGISWVDADSGQKGEIGAKGVQGTDGLKGIQGADGLKGIQGTDGLKGIQGTTGTATQGTTGTQGTDGLKGVKGTDGLKGIQGIQGTIGTTVVGGKGDKGEVGAKGQKGEIGAKGIQGTDGLKGTQGTDGNFGGASFEYLFNTQISNVDPGNGKLSLNNSSDQTSANKLFIDIVDENGVDITSFLQTLKDVSSDIKGYVRMSAQADATTFLLYQITTLTDNTTYWTIAITNQAASTTLPFSTNNEDLLVSFIANGDQGQKGDKGEKGVQGIKGIQGTDGLKGTQGTDGLKGIQGTDGLKGIQGTDGQKGIDGLKGVQGTDGIKGVEGDAATINPGIATGLAAGSAPTVANTGTTSAAIFDFGIPAGAKGIKGDTGSGGAGGFNPEISNTVRYIAKALSSGREWQMVSTGDIYKDLVYSRVGSTVTFQSKDHGLTTGDFIVVRGGIDSYLYVDVTVITIDEFTYLSPTTGTVSGTDAAYIPAFGVSVFSGTTSTVVAPSAGNIQMSSMVVARGIDFTTNFTLNMPNTITNGSGANTSATNQNPPIIACFNLSNGGFLTSVTVAVTTSSNFSRFTLGGLAAGVNNLMRFQF